MKKIIPVMLALLLALGATGCGIKTTETSETETTGVTVGTGMMTDSADAPESTSDVQTAEPVSSAVGTETDEGTDAPVESGLTVKTETFSDGSNTVTLMYPAYGDGDHDAFNTAMRDFAMSKFAKQGMMPEDSAVYEILTCDIKLETKSFMSAVVTGQIINPTAAHDLHFAYTVNADIVSGKVYLPEELVGDVDLIKAGLSDGKFTQSYGIPELMDAIADGIVSYESFTQSWRSDYGIYPDMYFTSDTIGIIAELPHAVGGYAGFEISYIDGKGMMSQMMPKVIG